MMRLFDREHNGIRVLMTSALAASLVSGSLLLAPSSARAVESNSDEYEAALARLSSISEQYANYAGSREETYAKLEEVRGQIAENEQRSVDVQGQIDAYEVELAGQRSVLAEHVAAGYKQGSVSLFSILLSASSFDEAVSRIYYYDTIARSEAEVIASINASQAELEQSQSELDSLNEELKAEEDALQTLYDKQSEQTGAMRAQQAEAANYLASLSTEVQARIEEEEPELAGISQIVIEDEATRATQQAEVVNDQPAAEQQNQGQQQAAEQATANETQQAQETQQAEESQPTSEPVSYSNGSLSAVINAAWSIGPTRSDWGCAGWVYTVYRDAGVYDQMPRCAGWYAENFGYSSDLGDLMPGMVVAVTTHPYTAAGRIYGHCGIYVGDGIVRDYAGGGIRSVSIDDWINSYSSPGIPVRWGWVGGIPLS